VPWIGPIAISPTHPRSVSIALNADMVGYGHARHEN